ncbi:MAG: hypothetical protein K0R98_130 [Rickettsiaceae bacterium]|nr:hypothetical protein [Rickettsiaceae bacterium]
MVNLIIAASPFILICYLFKTWVDHGEVASISLASALYYWLGLDPAFKSVTPGLEGFYNLYVFLLKLPLLFWLFVISIPSFLYIRRSME